MAEEDKQHPVYTDHRLYTISPGRFHYNTGQFAPGVCPIENKRPLMYIAAALALVSFIIAIVEDRIKGIIFVLFGRVWL